MAMSCESDFVFQSSVLPQNSFNFFEDAKEKEDYCDVILTAGDLSISANRIVIAAAIPHLRNALRDRGSDKEVQIPDVADLEPSAIRLLIEYAYHGKIKSTVENVMCLLTAASRFQMDEVRSACCSFLTENLFPNNAMKFRDSGRQLGCPDMVESADKYIAKNFDQVSQTDDFLNCSYSDLKELIGKDDIHTESEEKVYESVMKWITQSHDREKHLQELMGNVRLALIKPTYLRMQVARNKLIRDSTQVRDWVDEITTYFMFPLETDLSSAFSTEPRCYVNLDCTGKNKLSEVPVASSVNAESVGENSLVDITFPRQDIQQSNERYCDTNNEIQSYEHSGSGQVQFGGNSAYQKDNNPFEILFVEQLHSLQNPSLGTSKQKDHRHETATRGVAQIDPNFLEDTSASEEDQAAGIYTFHAKLLFSVQQYDFRRKTWRVKKTDSFTINTASVARLSDKICFIDCESMCYYNPSDNTVSLTERYTQGRALTAIGNILYIFGGSDGHTVFDSAECFDSETEEWCDLADMENCREFACCVALGGYLYIIGGNDLECIHNTVERYDTEAGEWTFVEPVLIGRSRLGAAALNGRIFISGGIISLDEQECSVTAEVYDPNTDQWVNISPMRTARLNFTLIAYAGKLYALGGVDDNDDYLNSVEVYIPRADIWQMGLPMPEELQITGAAAV